MIDTETITYRWIDGPTASDAEWDAIEIVLATRGWMSLNRNVTRIAVAEDAKGLAGFFVMDLLPHAGPLFVRPSLRRSEIAVTLAEMMNQFFIDTQARGVIIVAESPYVVKMCEARGMIRVQAPVYVLPGAEV